MCSHPACTVIKMSRLSKIAPLYRGWTGATLPSTFFEADWMGLRGGVEYGFSSTTTERAQAVHYAEGKASTILELEMGMVDRGADISWLSQCARPSWPVPACPASVSTPNAACAQAAHVLHMVQLHAVTAGACADPHEKETLLPPLMGIQVRGTSVDGGTLVVESRISLNMASLVRACVRVSYVTAEHGKCMWRVGTWHVA